MIFSIFLFLEFGDGWAPNVLDTQEEFQFLRDNMGFFFFNYDKITLVGGSTNVTQYGPISYSEYIPNDSGKICYLLTAEKE